MSSKFPPGHFLPCVVVMLMIVPTLAQDLPPLGSTLPKIDQENFQLTPQENGYKLRITLPDVSSRDEIVELKNPGTPEQYLAVQGTNIQIYPGASDKISYTADKNGYLAKYAYVLGSQAHIQMPEIGILALKSSAG